MGFGPRYEIAHEVDGREVTIVMRKAEPGDAEKLSGLMDHAVALDFINLPGSQTIKDEEEYLERLWENDEATAWIVAVRNGDTEELIGVTNLLRKETNRASSGIVLANPDWWGKGIASLTHRYRTWYAFSELGVHQIMSGFIAENQASGKALAKVGYVQCGIDYRAHLVAGAWRDEVMLSCYNPALEQVLWPNGDVPSEIAAGMKKTQAALDEVRKELNPR